MADLSETSIKKVQPKDAPYRLYDRDGLFLKVGARSKTWFHKGRTNGKDKISKLGEWPTLDLAGARLLALQVKGGEEVTAVVALDNAIKDKKTSKVKVNQLYQMLRDRQVKTCSESHIRATDNRYNLYIKNTIGDKEVNDLTYADLKHILKKLDKQGKADTAHKVTIIFHLMLNLAKVEEIITPEKEMMLKDLKGIVTPKAKIPLPALASNIEEFRELIKVILSTDKFYTSVRYALKISPFVALRPNELAAAKWSEINFESKEWTIPAERMKGKKGMRTDHYIPLTDNLCKTLKELKEMGLSEEWIFPQMHYGRIIQKPISSVAVGNALVDLGYKDKQSAHGFRACFRTYGAEYLEISREVLELQLHHNIGTFTPNGLSYNRVTLKEQRRKALEDYETFITPRD